MAKLVDRDKSLEELARANIVRLRKERGWSQAELAQRMSDLGFDGFGQMTVSRTEKGERPLRVSELEGYADVFEVRVTSLWSTELERELMSIERELGEARDDLRAATKRYMDAQRYLAALMNTEINEFDEADAYTFLADVATLPQEFVAQAVEDERIQRRAQTEAFVEAAVGETQLAVEERMRREFWDKPEDERSLRNLWKSIYGES